MNNLIPYISLGISIIALLISTVSFLLNFKKYRIEKSKLSADINKIDMGNLTAFYPSMEDDNSIYKLFLRVKNSGYKEELITQIIACYENNDKPLEIEKVIGPKKQESIVLEFRRIDIMKLKRLELVPVEDKKIVIKEKEFAKLKKEISDHIIKLSKERKDGLKIEKKEI